MASPSDVALYQPRASPARRSECCRRRSTGPVRWPRLCRCRNSSMEPDSPHRRRPSTRADNDSCGFDSRPRGPEPRPISMVVSLHICHRSCESNIRVYSHSDDINRSSIRISRKLSRVHCISHTYEAESMVLGDAKMAVHSHLALLYSIFTKTYGSYFPDRDRVDDSFRQSMTSLSIVRSQ